MKIIDLLFVNTFKQHVGNHDQCHPIWLCNRGSTTVVANLSFQRFFFFLNAQTFEREQMA